MGADLLHQSLGVGCRHQLAVQQMGRGGLETSMLSPELPQEKYSLLADEGSELDFDPVGALLVAGDGLWSSGEDLKRRSGVLVVSGKGMEN